MDANLLEVVSKLFARVTAEKSVQQLTEMTYSVHFHHSFQHDLIFWRIVRKVVETYLSKLDPGHSRLNSGFASRDRNISPGGIS